MNSELEQYPDSISDTDLAPRKPEGSWRIKWRAFTMTRGANAMLAIIIGSSIAGLFAIALEELPATLLLPLVTALSGLLIIAFGSQRELKERIETLSREVVQSSEQYQILTNNLAAAIIIRDGTGNLLFCSPYTEVLTGYSRQEIYEGGEELIGQIVHEDDRGLYQRAQKVAAYGEAFQYRFRFFHKSGIEMWAESRTVPILDDTGVVTSSLSVLLDITGTALYQKQVEEMNRDSQDFSYMISHDLKAPIATIKGMLTLLQEESASVLDSESKEALHHIGNATQRLEQLVGAVLEYSRISNTQAEREAIDLVKVLHDIATDYSPALKAQAATFEFDTDAVSIQGEELRIYQIFSNLVGNALKYHDPDRPLKISVAITTPPSSRWVTVAVKDNGIGIPEEKQHAVFRPFYRAHRDHTEGAGVGLACVKKIVEKLGGEISLSSSEGIGSEFTIKFVRG